MVTRTSTVAFRGIDVLPIDVQVQISSGMPAFSIVGLPDKAVAESRDRIRAAFHAIGLSFPFDRLTVNLAPADVQKEGSHYDLPIALGILGSMGIVPKEEIEQYTALGELGLDGSIASVGGILSAAIEAHAQGKGLICPSSTGSEAAWAGEGLLILAPQNLLCLINHFKGHQVLSRPEPKAAQSFKTLLDLKDIKGQETARRALEIAAAGRHNMLLIGPPGVGKSMLASRLPSILPPLSPQEALEVSMVHSIAGLLEDGSLITSRPYRDPHHSASLPAMVGGGIRARPGEISLAHHGVLFLDELPEFSRGTLEALRQPLETGRVTVSRVNNHVTYPAQVQLVAAMNPCRCGYLSDPSRACSRVPKCALDYQAKISGPLLDRIDLYIEVENIPSSLLSSPISSESSETVRTRVFQAHAFQKERFKDLKLDNNKDNDNIANKTFSQKAQTLLTAATDTFRISARGYTRISRVARTIADLSLSSFVEEHHIAEALNYRRALG